MIQAPWERRRAPSPWVPEPELATGISIIVPVYRSAETLRELVRRLTETLGALGEPYEIVLVEDASPDGSWSVIGDLATDDQRVRGIQLSRNYGQHNALLCGSGLRGSIARSRSTTICRTRLKRSPNSWHVSSETSMSSTGPRCPSNTDCCETSRPGSPSSHCRRRWVPT